MVRQVSVSAVVAFAALVTGVGVANATTHISSSVATKMYSASASSSQRAMSRTPRSAAMTAEPKGGFGGDVTALATSSITVLNQTGTLTTYDLNALTTVTKERIASTAASLTIGEHVHLTLSAINATLATAIDIVSATTAGRVTAVTGDTITVASPVGTSGTIVVGATTTYAKSGTTGSQKDVTVGTFVFAEGTFGSTHSTINAITVGIGQPSPITGPLSAAGSMSRIQTNERSVHSS